MYFQRRTFCLTFLRKQLDVVYSKLEISAFRMRRHIVIIDVARVGGKNRKSGNQKGPKISVNLIYSEHKTVEIFKKY